jgi:hypothetical protein
VCGAPMRNDWFRCSTARHGYDDVAKAKPLVYASRTGSRRNLAAMAEAGIRLLATPQQLGRYPDAHPPWAYMLDNGAFGEGGFQPDQFATSLRLLGRDADAVVLPDIVCGGQASLRLSLDWMHRVLQVGARYALIPVQDGMVPADVRRYLTDVYGRVGLFVGGSTAWKESTMRMWGDLAEEMACWMHVGRVNTQRRMALAVAAGAHSVDGSSATRFACRAAPLVASARQGDMFRVAT